MPPYNQLKFKGVGTPPQPHEDLTVEGWDTETIDGKATIAANSERWEEITCWEDALCFLAGPQARGNRNLWWNLDYDVTAVLKWVPGILEEVVEEGFYVDNEENPTLQISYIPHKMLKIRRWDSVTVYHYDLLQFFRCGLDYASRRYLDREPPEIKEDRADLFSHYDTQEIGEYCQWDATATRDLGVWYFKSLHELDLYPKHLISSGNLAERFVLQKGNVPTWRDNPKKINQFFWKALRGAWVDVWKKGHFEEVYKYDLKSAYPAVINDLPDFRQGEWLKNVHPEDYDIGVALIELNHTQDSIPCLPTFFDMRNVYPHLDQPVRIWATFSEVRRYQQTGDIDIIESYGFHPTNDNKPWESLVQKLLKLKNERQGEGGLYMATKAIINSFYGKTVQRVEMDNEDAYLTGRIFNPVTACEILARCRMWLWDAIRGDEDKVISIATDCVMTTEPLDLDIGDELGDWEVEAEGEPGIFVATGIYEIEGDRPHTRGFQLDGNLWDLLDTDGEEFKFTFERPITSREAVNWGRIEEANEFTKRPYTISVWDSRRIWDPQPTQVRQFRDENFDSDPVPVSTLKSGLEDLEEFSRSGE